MRSLIFTLCVFLLSNLALAEDFETQARQSLNQIVRNLENRKVSPGAVIASPSQSNPNYFFHWIRDAAVTMNIFADIYTNGSGSQRQAAMERLKTWVAFETQLQQLQAKGGLGEPKYNVDGTVFSGDWGRPQNDGPALRALTMIHFAQSLLKNGEEEYVHSSLYASEMPAQTPIKKDLEYVAANWQNPSVDLWEEVTGDHFYTRLVQLAALTEGAELAQTLDDSGAADYYKSTASKIASSLNDFIGDDLIIPTLHKTQGGEAKKSNLDVGVLLAFLHAGSIKGTSFLDGPLMSSMQKLEASFAFYPVNQNSGGMASAIGRYPEDVYDGNGFSGGNPWFIGTAAFAEVSCRQADELQKSRKLKVTPENLAYLQSVVGNSVQLDTGDTLKSSDEEFAAVVKAFKQKGEDYLNRILFHAGNGGSLSEQFNRENGFMQGARELTWSHVSYITAYRACFHKMPRLH